LTHVEPHLRDTRTLLSRAQNVRFGRTVALLADDRRLVEKATKTGEKTQSTYHYYDLAMIHNLRNDQILPQLMDELSDLGIEHKSLGCAFDISDPAYVDAIDYRSGPGMLEGDFLVRLAEVDLL
jgi:hypothetical protein